MSFRLREATRASCRRARKREEALLYLERHGRATLRELAWGVGVRPARVRGILFGGGREYSAERGIVRIEAVRCVRTRFGDAFELTERGAAEAACVRELRAARRPV